MKKSGLDGLLSGLEVNKLMDLDCLSLLALESVEGELSLTFGSCDVNEFKMFHSLMDFHSCVNQKLAFCNVCITT